MYLVVVKFSLLGLNQLKLNCYLFGLFCFLCYLFLRIGSDSGARNQSYLRRQVQSFVSTKVKNTFQSFFNSFVVI